MLGLWGLVGSLALAILGVVYAAVADRVARKSKGKSDPHGLARRLAGQEIDEEQEDPPTGITVDIRDDGRHRIVLPIPPPPEGGSTEVLPEWVALHMARLISSEQVAESSRATEEARLESAGGQVRIVIPLGDVEYVIGEFPDLKTARAALDGIRPENPHEVRTGAADVSSGATVADRAPQRWRALSVIAFVQLLVAVDTTVVTIALPSLQHGLGISDSDRQWVITAYCLAFGGFLLAGGKIAGRVGPKQAYIIALIGLAGVSVLGGASAGPEVLFAVRALQGAFAGILAPTAFVLLSAMFTEPKERRAALAICGAAYGAGGMVGLVAGGVLRPCLRSAVSRCWRAR